MWSGSLNLKSRKLYFSNLLRKRVLLNSAYRHKFLVVPSSFKFCFFQNNVLYIYSNVYFFLFYCHGIRLVYRNFLIISNLNTFVNYKYFNFIDVVFFSFSNIFFKKIKFTGKGYRLYRSLRNVLTLQFNHSHRIYQYFFLVSLIFLNKYTILFSSLRPNELNLKLYKLKSWRPANLYTMRGIRFTKQVVFKKVGKISTY